MTRTMRALQLGGVSLLALAVAGMFSPADAQECSAVPTFAGTDGEVSSVTVSCAPGEESQTFATSFGGEATVVIPGSGTDIVDLAYDGTGDDVFNMSGGAILDDLLIGTPVLELDGTTPPEYVGILGNLDPSTDFIELLDGNDTVNMTGGEFGTEADPVSIALGDASSGLGNDADVFNMSGGTVWGGVFGLGGGNTYDLSGDAIINGQLFAGSQDDTVSISGDAIVRGVNNFDDFTAVGLEDGDDVFTMTGGTLLADVTGGSGVDDLSISGGTIEADVYGKVGDDTISVSGGSIALNVFGDEGDDQIEITGGTIGVSVNGGLDDDFILVSGEAVIGTPTSTPDTLYGIDGGDGDDTVEITGGRIIGDVVTQGGNDEIIASGGSMWWIDGDTGDDVIEISGSAVVGANLPAGFEDAGFVDGGAGDDSVTVSGGTVNGDIIAESVNLFGGSISGDILGLSGNTLVINDPDGNLNLRDGVLFSGTNAVGTITDTDLTGGARNFEGFSSLTLNNSRLAFGPGVFAQIDQLNLLSGSNLSVNGTFGLGSQGTGFGDLNVDGSTVNFVNNDPTDVLRIDNLTLNGATIAVDVDQTAGQSDNITAASMVSNGTNTIAVNLLGTPVLSAATDIPVIISGSQSGAGTFVVTGIPDSAAALFTYEIVPDGAGGFVLRATPSAVGLGAATQIAIDSQPAILVTETVSDLTGDAIDSAMGLGANSGIAVTPTFAVFASGQFARVEHDSFTVSTDNFVGAGPDFTADDFSAAISLDFNAAKHFGFDNQYGLNLGLFGGYASTDVNLGSFQSFSKVGDAENGSGMFGGYALFRQDVNYLLVSGTGFWGNTDINNNVFDSTGSYDTTGYAFTASAGRIFSLNDRVRFDLRGGILGVHFEGDSYVDSAGIDYGTSTVSFGAVKFEPGVYADYRWDNGMVFSPYLRGELQQRFSYKNEGTIDTVAYDFEDADFSGALSAGFNLRTSERFTVSSEIRGRWSEDSSTVAGKFGVKISF